MINTMEKIQARCKMVPLGMWISAAEALRMPFVAAEFSQSFKLDDLCLVLDGMDPVREAQAALRWVEHQVKFWDGGKVMVRFESSSGLHIKSDAADGIGWQPSWAELVLDDPRTMETAPFGCAVLDENGMTRFVVRPYVEPYRIGTHPLEFRVYADHQDVLGVSNYYPQISLTGEEDIPAAYTSVKELADEALDLGRQFFSLFKSTGDFASEGFTADFLVSESGELLFLEGGPPCCNGMVSAHPCCFDPKNIYGYAFSPQPGSPGAAETGL